MVWHNVGYRLPLLPNVSLLPSIPLTSFELNLSSAPLSLPTPGPSIIGSFRLSLVFFLLAALSKITPFSFASRLLFVSRPAAAAFMPLRIFMGILSCVRMEALEPSAWTRRSVAFRRMRPALKALGSLAVVEAKGEWLTAREKRWDSARRRRSSRSCARREGASSGRVEEASGAVELSTTVLGAEEESGGREDCSAD